MRWMGTKTAAGLKAIPGALLRAAVGATAGGALSALVALAGYGLAREKYGTHDPSALEMSTLGGAVILAIPGALAVVRMYSERERWTSAALTLTLFPGAVLGAIGGVAALAFGRAAGWALHQAGITGPTHTWSQIVLGGTLVGGIVAVTGLRRRRRSRKRPPGPSTPSRRLGEKRRRK